MPMACQSLYCPGTDALLHPTCMPATLKQRPADLWHRFTLVVTRAPHIGLNLFPSGIASQCAL